MSLFSSLVPKLVGLKVVHRLPGRIRIHVPGIRRSGPQAAQACREIERYIARPSPLHSVHCSPYTGNILIRYDSGVMGEERLLEALNHLAKRAGRAAVRCALLPSSRRAAAVERLRCYFREHPIDITDRRSFEVPDEIWT